MSRSQAAGSVTANSRARPRNHRDCPDGVTSPASRRGRETRSSHSAPGWISRVRSKSGLLPMKALTPALDEIRTRSCPASRLRAVTGATARAAPRTTIPGASREGAAAADRRRQSQAAATGTKARRLATHRADTPMTAPASRARRVRAAGEDASAARSSSSSAARSRGTARTAGSNSPPKSTRGPQRAAASGRRQPDGRRQGAAPEPPEEDAGQGPDQGLEHPGGDPVDAGEGPDPPEEVGVERGLPEGGVRPEPGAGGQLSSGVGVGSGVDDGSVEEGTAVDLAQVGEAEGQGEDEDRRRSMAAAPAEPGTAQGRKQASGPGRRRRLNTCPVPRRR